LLSINSGTRAGSSSFRARFATIKTYNKGNQNGDEHGYQTHDRPFDHLGVPIRAQVCFTITAVSKAFITLVARVPIKLVALAHHIMREETFATATANLI